jgi:ribose 5-phosphate isomerase A
VQVDLAERMARLAAVAADLVQPGMIVGLGTGSTADAVIRELGRRVSEGLSFTGVPTSCHTEALARDLGIPLTTLDTVDRLDLGIDGADEIAPNLDAIKGKGGALLYEKLVALACEQFVLVATTEKNVELLGERTALPVEIVRFGWPQTARRLGDLGFVPEFRLSPMGTGQPFVSDNGSYILDCQTGPMDDPAAVAKAVKTVPGVIEHGLFLGVAHLAIQVDPEGTVTRRERAPAAYLFS